MDLRAFWLFLKQELTVRKMLFLLMVLVLIANLGPLAHFVFHPDLSYFDKEHVLTNGVYAMLICLLFAGQIYYVAQQKMARAALVDRAKDLEQQVQARTTDLQLQPHLLDAAMDSIMLLDMEGNCIHGNEAAWKSRGYSKEELLALNMLEMEAPECGSGVKGRLAEIVAQGKVACSAVHHRKDGSTMPVEIHSRLLEVGGQTILLAVLLDTRGRQSGEEALRNSDALYKNLANNLSLGVAVISPAMEVLSLNKKMAEWFPEVDPAQKPFCYRALKKTPAEKPCADCPAVKTFRDGRVHESVSKTSANDNSSCFKVIASPLKNEAGVVEAVIKIVEDVSLRRKMEAELQQAQTHAESASRVKSDFLANISHEFVTPLNAILGFSQILQGELYGPLNKTQHEYLDTVLNSGMELLQKIKEMITLSMLLTRDLGLCLTRFSLKDALQGSIVPFQQEAERQGLQFSIEIEPGGVGEIEADLFYFKQILSSLLANAVKFSPNGGHIRLTARKLPKGMEISVSDTGIGIRQEDLSRIFTEFSQLESPYTKKFQGTGLGLGLTRELVRLHGGRIWAESTYGKGSTFTFMLPMQPLSIEE